MMRVWPVHADGFYHHFELQPLPGNRHRDKTFYMTRCGLYWWSLKQLEVFTPKEGAAVTCLECIAA